jgi:hypothetical protein
MGYELELKVKFRGQGRWEGLEGAIELSDLCDDGGDPESKIFVTKEGAKSTGTKFREEARNERLVMQVTEKCREVLNIVRDEA